MNKPLTVEVLRAMFDASEAMRLTLLDEKTALLGQPSPLFKPRSETAEGRELERQAFAKGFHHAAISQPRKN